MVTSMRMNEGVEWAVHSCLNLAWVEPGQPVTAARLAAYFELPAAYLNKQLQALARAGIVSSTPGPRGGFRLERGPAEITLLDVVVAIDGPDEAFRCTNILGKSPFGDSGVDYREHCAVSQAMRSADLAWRRELAGRTIADLKKTVEKTYPGADENIRRWFATT
jgi:Rrf2 family protein